MGNLRKTLGFDKKHKGGNKPPNLPPARQNAPPVPIPTLMVPPATALAAPPPLDLPPGAPLPGGAGERPPKPVPIAVVQVRAACGHGVACPVYEPDPHREARRARIEGKNCPLCRQQAHLAKNAAARQAAKEKRRKEGKDWTWRLRNKRRRYLRLPDLAEFHCTYSAKDTRWTGRLVLPTFETPAGLLVRPGEEGSPLVFEDGHSSLSGLQTLLRERFIAWSAGLPDGAPSPAPAAPCPAG